MSRSCVSLVLLVLLATTSSAQQPSSQHGPVKLVWKFKEKDRFILESQVSQVQMRRGGGQLHKDVVRAQVISSFTVIKVEDKDKSVELEQKIEDARFLFDGTDRLNAALHADLYGKLKGAVFHITLTEEGKVRKLEGYDALVKSIAENSAQDAERFKVMVPEESLKNATEEGFGCFPITTLKQGETWSRPVTIPVPPAGALKGEMTYTLRGVTRGKAKVTGKCDSCEYQPGSNLSTGIKSSFTLDTRESVLQFDLEKGRLASAEINTRFRGRLTNSGDLELNSVPLLEVEMQQNVKISVRDKSR